MSFDMVADFVSVVISGSILEKREGQFSAQLVRVRSCGCYHSVKLRLHIKVKRENEIL